jgi:hypothetical protein
MTARRLRSCRNCGADIVKVPAGPEVGHRAWVHLATNSTRCVAHLARPQAEPRPTRRIEVEDQ